jgi:BirA family biotin operon repressor/biotin-[acetyl-CoA-carboxylase] ligase
MERLGSLPLAVAVAVQEAVSRIMPLDSPDVLIKWPNDILIDRRKICGILIEGETLADGRHAVVIGCGINVAVAPEAGLYPVATLRGFGASASPDELFAWLFRSMAETLALWNRGRGISAVMERWKSVAGGIGENITVNLPDRSISGRFAGIDDTGLLKLETDDGGTRLIAAGDVFFG